jgi:hypothetical protein
MGHGSITPSRPIVTGTPLSAAKEMHPAGTGPAELGVEVEVVFAAAERALVTAAAGRDAYDDVATHHDLPVDRSPRGSATASARRYVSPAQQLLFRAAS